MDSKGNRYAKRFSGKDLVRGDDKPFDPSPLLNIAPVVVLWGGNHFANKLPSSSCWLVWDKRCGTTTNDFADCEIAWTNIRRPARVINHLWNGMLKDSERGHERVHPTQKPIRVMIWCIECAGMPDTILDPFMGYVTMENVPKGDPTLALRVWLSNHPDIGGYAGRRNLVNVTCSAIRNHFEGVKISKIVAAPTAHDWLIAQAKSTTRKVSEIVNPPELLKLAA